MAEKPESIERLERTWASATGFPRALAEVNNRPLGMRFMVTAFMFFLLGGVLALLMRVQLAVSENTFLGPEVYNQLFTMHGSTMMFLFAVPFLEGLALYLLPPMLGARDVAFPRLTAYGYWVYLFGGLIFYASFLFGAAPDAGWFAYTPLSTAKFTGIGSDFWLLGLSLVEVAGLTAAAEIVVTILKFRAPGMTLGRMPLFVWAMLVVGLMILVAFTVLLTATVLLELDRSLETRIFDVERGGNNLLWQHLFWFFGHPEVYIMFLPATGIVSMIVPVFARRPVVGYLLITVAIVVTGFVSFGLWVHHMFAAGLPALSMSFFTAASLMIAIASGTQVFAWIATLWGSGPKFTTPLLFVLGFIFIFVLGGMTGVMIAVVPFDLQVHDTYFIVAHFHYVLIGGVLFPIFAGLYYWIPKFTGRMLSARLGQASFWLMFLGFNVTFFPMHIMGFLGLPRRVYTYPRVLELDGYNLAATGGAFMLGAGVLVFLIDLARGLRRGEEAGDNPWGADTLEWSIPSPPPPYTFAGIPDVRSRHPLWKAEAPKNQGDEAVAQARAAMFAAPQLWRATLVTDALDARPQSVQWIPGPTYIPLLAALATTAAAAGVLSRAYLLAALACAATAVAVIAWLTPKRKVLAMLRETTLEDLTDLPVLTRGPAATVWWGMLSVVTILGTSLASLIYSYFYLRLFSSEWPQGEIRIPELWLPLTAYGLLAAAGATQYFAMRQFLRHRWLGAQLGLGAVFVMGLAFLALQAWELRSLDFAPQTNAYGSIFYILSWFVTLVVAVGLAIQVGVQFRLPKERHDRDGFMGLQMELALIYWLFVAAASVLVFATLYLSPRWL